MAIKNIPRHVTFDESESSVSIKLIVGILTRARNRTLASRLNAYKAAPDAVGESEAGLDLLAAWRESRLGTIRGTGRSGMAESS